jgi:ADP-ribose pyrophosphatase
MEITRPESKQPMPAHATRVFKGVVFDVYQWEQEGYDGSVHTFEKLKRSDTVVVIAVTPDKKIVVTDQMQPGWVKPKVGLLGGRVDEGEDVLDAAKRELLEESGYQSNDWSLFMSLQPVGKIDWAVFTFVAKDVKKVADQSLDGAEQIDEFVEIAIQPDFYEDDLRVVMLEAKLNPAKMEKIKQAIVG